MPCAFASPASPRHLCCQSRVAPSARRVVPVLRSQRGPAAHDRRYHRRRWRFGWDGCATCWILLGDGKRVRDAIDRERGGGGGGGGGGGPGGRGAGGAGARGGGGGGGGGARPPTHTGRHRPARGPTQPGAPGPRRGGGRRRTGGHGGQASPAAGARGRHRAPRAGDARTGARRRRGGPAARGGGGGGGASDATGAARGNRTARPPRNQRATHGDEETARGARREGEGGRV